MGDRMGRVCCDYGGPGVLSALSWGLIEFKRALLLDERRSAMNRKENLGFLALLQDLTSHIMYTQIQRVAP